MIAKEVGYTGFGSMPVLSRHLFGTWFILAHYDPLERFSFDQTKALPEGFASRLNSASKMIVETAIENGDYWPQRYVHSVRAAYEGLCRQWSYMRPRDLPIEYAVALHMGIQDLYKTLNTGLRQLAGEQRKPLFITDPKAFRTDLVDSIAGIVYESLACNANEFNGADDPAWVHAISAFLDIYPAHESEPVGMNPLQQHLAIQLIDKLRQNMEGWYPAISRVLLAVIGPYDRKPQIANRTAHVILKDAVYKELQRLPTLHAKNPEKVPDFLPSSVTYDPTTNTITHAYRGGGTKSTNLGALTIPDVDLTDQRNWQTGESSASERAAELS